MNVKVIIGQPVNKAASPKAALSFARFLTISTLRGVVGAVYQSETNPLGRARNSIVEEALKTDGTHLLFLDNDMVVHPEALTGLLTREVDVVSGLYFMRTPPHLPVAFKDINNPTIPYSDYPPGLSKVWLVGMGFALIRFSVFRRMTEKYGDNNWFSFEAGDGEDAHFCRRLAEMQIPVYLDANVKCGHVAEVVLGEDHFKRHRIGDLLAV
jgi:hypothetical protein